MSLPPPRSRRRLSRTIPWYLPVAAGVVLLLLLFGLVQGVRAVWQRDDEDNAPSTSEQQSDTTPITATEGVTFTAIVGGDPLTDPTLNDSALDDDGRMTFLLLGTDGREVEEGPPRTDLVMVAVADRTDHTLTLISIPRDLWVPIPDYGEGKVNTAYFLGALDGDGMTLAKETVSDLVGFPLEYAVTVDFEGFRAIVDAMGGIEVDVPEPIDDPDYPDYSYGTFRLEISAGIQTMDGETALRYARTRYGGTDIDRAGRQQLVLMAVREKALEAEQLALAPIHLRTLYREVESNLTLSDFFALARFGRDLQREDIAMHTIDSELTYPILTWNGQDALLYDPAEVRAQIAAWLE